MPANPRLGPEEMDQLTAFLLAPAGRGRLGAGGAGFGRGATPAAEPIPAGLLAGTGGARGRPLVGRGAGPARGGAPPTYPDGVPTYEQFSINGQYGTIGNMMKPPYTVITAYDLNKGTIKWQTGFGDDPALAAQGIKGTGVTQMRNSIVITASGLVFGFGGDSTVYAYDADTGKVLWSAPLGGAVGVRGSPSMFELDGREYLLVPIGNAMGGLRVGGAAGATPAAPHPNAPSGYVTFALPAASK
jgi:quinoprotein glucose dehydrogenase